MIVRLWKGRVPTSKAASYQDYVYRTGIQDYRSKKGCLDAKILTQTEADITHIITYTLWEDIASIKEFAGDDYQKAKYYPEDKQYLLEFAEHVEHFEVSNLTAYES